MSIIADGITDQTGPVIDAMVAGDRLPPGDIRITSDLISTATSSFSPGITLRGAGMLRTRIIADYNGDLIRGGIVRLDVASGSKYSVGNIIEDLTLMRATGRSGLNGISLTGAWMNAIHRVRITGGCNTGIITPLRTDINPISDYYQCFSLIAEQCWIEGCIGNGIDFGAGQSPGLYRLAYSQIINNLGIGVRTTTGQCEIDSNVISYNGVGGLMFDTAEGPSMVGKVTRNEIQDNQSWGVNLIRSRDLRIIQNRFLGQTYSASNGSPQNGGSFMKQFVHVNLGSGVNGEVYNLLCERNLHRTVNGQIPTTASCFGYDASSGSLSAAFPCQFIKNDFGPWPPDGLNQNSTGFGKYIGPMPGAIIVDP